MGKINKATHQGVIHVGDISIPCFVLEDGRRVLSGRGMQGALGLGQLRGQKINRLVDNNQVKPFIDEALALGISKPIEFNLPNSLKAFGYEANLLVELCDVLLTARNEKALPARYAEAATYAEILIRAFAKIGIIALVDEVTGYQAIREKDALQVFLQKFLDDERGKWVKTFPDEFFESIFKMRGLSWSMANTGKKPQYIGHYINNYVYSRIAPQVLTELRRLSPKDEKGRRKGAYTQYIDIEYGHPKLKEHLNILIAFAKATGYNWNNWHRMVERALPKFEQDGSQSPELPFDDM